MKSKKNARTGNKTLIIILSFIPYLNGLGLIVAGKRANKKNWLMTGFIYIILEWILMLTGIGAVIDLLLFIIAIIHTVLISSEYVSILSKQNIEHSDKDDINKYAYVQAKKEEKKKRENNKQERATQNNVNDLVLNDAEEMTSQKEDVKEENRDEVNYRDLDIDIGSASVIGENRGNLLISITDDSGKIYKFRSRGNSIVSFKVGSGREIKYKSAK